MIKNQIDQKIQKITDKIKKEIKPEKIILFGSFAWGEPHEDSDLDLFVIVNTENTRKTAQDIDRFIFPREFPIDFVVSTPERVFARLGMGDKFMEEIINNGKVLYEQK